MIVVIIGHLKRAFRKFAKTDFFKAFIYIIIAVSVATIGFSYLEDRSLADSFYWAIITLGTHPCAYVGIPRDDPSYEEDYDDIGKPYFDCNGGITFSGHNRHCHFTMFNLDIWWIGWDYAHAGDYLHYPEHFGIKSSGKKWTLEEIEEEVMKVIEQLKKIRDEK